MNEFMWKYLEIILWFNKLVWIWDEFIPAWSWKELFFMQCVHYLKSCNADVFDLF